MVMLLDLDRNEYDVVFDVLTRAMADLREEIYKTDSTDYKAALRQREAVLRAVLQRLTAAGVSASGEAASAAP
jgi:hypothetical protein